MGTSALVNGKDDEETDSMSSIVRRLVQVITFGFVRARRAQLVFSKNNSIPLLDSRAYDHLIIGRKKGLSAGREGKTAFLDSERQRINIINALTPVSRRHASLTWNPEERKYELEDLGSTYGTKVDGKMLIPGTVALLDEKSRVCLGKRAICFEVLY